MNVVILQPFWDIFSHRKKGKNMKRIRLLLYVPFVKKFNFFPSVSSLQFHVFFVDFLLMRSCVCLCVRVLPLKKCNKQRALICQRRVITASSSFHSGLKLFLRCSFDGGSGLQGYFLSFCFFLLTSGLPIWFENTIFQNTATCKISHTHPFFLCTSLRKTIHVLFVVC